MPLQSETDAGMVEGGTLEPRQPKLFETELGHTLLPAVDQAGNALPDEQILSDFARTKQHLGVFKTPEAADKYATRFPAVRPAPEVGSVLGAMFRQENEIVSALTRQYSWDNLPERGFDLTTELKARGQEQLFDKLVWVNNAKQLDIALSNIAKERQDREIIDLAPWWQALPMGVAAGVLSPTMLLPGGEIVRATKGGFSMVKSAALIGGFAGGGIAVQEGLLHASQSERTLGESAVNVAAGVVLGGLIGAGAAKVLSRAERATAERASLQLYRTLEDMRTAAEGVTHDSNTQFVLDIHKLWSEAKLPPEEFKRYIATLEDRGTRDISEITDEISGLRNPADIGYTSKDEYWQDIEFSALLGRVRQQTGVEPSVGFNQLSAMNRVRTVGERSANENATVEQLKELLRGHRELSDLNRVLEDVADMPTSVSRLTRLFPEADKAQVEELIRRGDAASNHMDGLAGELRELWLKGRPDIADLVKRFPELEIAGSVMDHATGATEEAIARMAQTVPDKRGRSVVSPFAFSPDTDKVAEWVTKAANVERKEIDRTLSGLADKVSRGEITAIEDVLDRAAPGAEVFSPGGADVPHGLSREDYGVAGGKVSSLGKIGRQFFPALRMSYSPFTSVRKLFNELTGSNLHTNASRSGVALAPGGSAFDQMKVEYHRLYAAGLTEQFNIYKEMKKAGVNMSWAEYDKAVGQALRDGDVGKNDYVSKGAVAWRTISIDPMAELQKAVGALSLDGDVVGAKSYFPRSHNRDVVIAHQSEFERRLLPRAESALTNAYAEAQKKLGNRIERLDRELGLLRLDGEGRKAALAEVERDIERLWEEFPEMVKLEDQLKAATERLRDRSLAPDVRAAIKEDQTALRAALKAGDFAEARAALERQRKAIDLSFGGNEAKADKIIDKLEQLNEEALRNTQRLITRGQQFQREKNRLDPKAWEKKRNELRQAFTAREAEYDKHVDRIEQELWNIDNEIKKAHEAIEIRDVEAGTNIERIKGQQEEVAKLERALAPVKKRLEKEKVRAEKAKANMARVNERLAAAEDFDPEEVMQLFRVATEELQEDMANAMTFRGMRAQRLIDRLEKVSPDAIKEQIAKREARITQLKERFDDRWTPDRTEKPPLADWAKAMVRDYFDAVTGIKYDRVEDHSDFAWPTKVGPLKDRANWVPESVLTAPVPGATRGFLNDDASHVLHHYLRVMAGDVALRRQFRNISLEPQLAELSREFSAKQTAVGAAKSTEELRDIVGDTGIRFGKDLEKNRQRAYQFLDVQHRAGQEDVRALRDRVLGRYKVAENHSNFGRFVRAANQINYMRLMGGVVLSSLTEIYRPAMVHGIGNFVNHIVEPMLNDIEALKLGVKEAKDLGLITEMTMLNRMHDFAEIADPMAHRTAIERLIDNGTSAATRWSGLAAWTDLGQAQAAIMTQARVLKAIQNGTDTEYLRFLNIGKSHERDIQKLFKQYGEVRSGVFVSNADRWTEGLTGEDLHRVEQARMALWSAIRKEVDSIIVMQSAGDTPLFASTLAGKAILQFRSYNMSAHQKVMLRGLQEGPGRFVSGLATMTMMGMGVAALQAWRGGEERWKKFRESAANPGFLVGEGLDKSGIFPLLFDVGQATDSVARTMGASFNPVKTPMLLPFPQASQAGDQTRWALGQGAWGLAGPTANFFLRDVPRAAGAGMKWAHGQELSASEKKALQEPLPYKNYVGMNWILQTLRGE